MDKVDALSLLIGFLTEDEYNRLMDKILKKASNESPIVNNNEQKEKNCNHVYVVDGSKSVTTQYCCKCGKTIKLQF